MSRMLLVRVHNNDHKAVLGNNESCHVTIRSLPTNYGLEKLGKFPQIRALLMVRDHYTTIDCLPYDLFMTLELLQALDLSGTEVLEVPSSVVNVKTLGVILTSLTPP